MEKLKNLTELQIMKMYNETNDVKYLNFVNDRIDKLHEDKIDPNTLSNEQLTLLCQKYGDDIYWTALYNKTKNSIHYCIHKYANDFYKAEYIIAENKEDTDLFSTIRLGWFRAVNTYNITKGNAGFVAYASTLMYQHYIKLTNKVNQKHNGLSVNSVFIESVQCTSMNNELNTTTRNKIIDNIYADGNTSDMDDFEAKEFMQQKLLLLKQYNKIIYEVIVMHYFKGKTQVQIANHFNRNKTWVARQLRRGRQYLRSRIPSEEYLQVMKDLDKNN